MGVLCFGSYAKLLGKATGLKQSSLVDLLFRCIKSSGSYSLDSGDVSNWVNSKLELRDFIVNAADSVGVLPSSEDYFSTNVVSKIKARKLKDFLESLHGLIESDAGILPDLKTTLLKVASVERVAAFLSRSFLYAVKQTNVVDGDPLDGVTQLPLLDVVAFEKMSLRKGFDNVFIKVDGCKSSDGFEIEFRRLSVTNKAFDYAALKNHLRKNLERYVFSRARIEKMVENEEQDQITEQALAFLKTKGNFAQLGNKLGNIILCIMLEELLDAPKIFYQIEVSTEGSLSSKGGLHLLRVANAQNSYKIIFGKSALIGNLTSAIDGAFEIITKSKGGDSESLPLLEPTIMSQFADKPTRDYLKSILIPTQRSQSLEVDTAYGIFLGYNLGIDAEAEFTKLAEEKMNAYIQSCVPYIKNKITELELGNYPFYFYLIPFNDVDSDKQAIMTSVCGGGAD